ncbi:hypothetical protein KIW84_015721 [Lathyrus oleraceus]|uniref:Uncharacterized protein n=1 Tax=Pisum sativum TaxID=3888 RepID=A0A9D5H145_PEA|nr:hypothetical protein KIW84_015721 [Pisum sativum]
MRKKLLISCSSLHSILNVNPNCDHLSIEICDSVGSSKFQWRGWSHAAACVPSETSDIRWKRGQRVPKHERRAMVSIRECWKTLCNKAYQKKGYQWQSYLMKAKTVKDGPIQGRVQPVRVHVTLAPEFLEGKGGPQFSSWEARLCNEFEIVSAPDDHCTTSASSSIQGAELLNLSAIATNCKRLWIMDCIGDKWLVVVATICKELQELRVFPSAPFGNQAAVTEVGLVAISKGCPKLHSLLYF